MKPLGLICQYTGSTISLVLVKTTSATAMLKRIGSSKGLWTSICETKCSSVPSISKNDWICPMAPDFKKTMSPVCIKPPGSVASFDVQTFLPSAMKHVGLPARKECRANVVLSTIALISEWRKVQVAVLSMDLSDAFTMPSTSLFFRSVVNVLKTFSSNL